MPYRAVHSEERGEPVFERVVVELRVGALELAGGFAHDLDHLVLRHAGLHLAPLLGPLLDLCGGRLVRALDLAVEQPVVAVAHEHVRGGLLALIKHDSGLVAVYGDASHLGLLGTEAFGESCPGNNDGLARISFDIEVARLGVLDDLLSVGVGEVVATGAGVVPP